MLTLAERREALIVEAKGLAEKAETDGRDISLDEANRILEISKEVKNFQTQIDAYLEHERLKAALGGGHEDIVIDPAMALTLGDHFAKSSAFVEMKDRLGSTRFTVATPEWKAPPAPSLSTGLGQIQYGGWVELPLQRPTVADLFSQGTLAGTSFQYYQQAAVTGDFGWVAENTEKPGMVFGGSTVSEVLAKIAGIVKITDETAEDVPALISIINSQLRLRLALAEEQGLLNGTGVAPQIKGLLTRAVQTEAAATAADNAEAIFRASTKVQTATYLNADALVINPLDYQNIRLNKDGNGQYFAGGPFTGQYGVGGVPQQPPIWGLPTVVTTAVPKGTAVVGAFKAGGQVFRKGGVRVESTNSDQDDFRFNRIALRAEERLLLAVYLPLAFVKVTLL